MSETQQLVKDSAQPYDGSSSADAEVMDDHGIWKPGNARGVLPPNKPSETATAQSSLQAPIHHEALVPSC